jgi:hypothetical protein
MARIAYQSQKISADRLEIIQTCNDIIAEYQDDDLMLTLRQLYYQLVSRDVIPNTVQSYKRVGDIVNDARMCGLMDWNAIEDRTRNLDSQPHWDSPASILDVCADQFRVDRWENQPNYVEVWVEKEALAGVFARACKPLDVPLFCCRGYTSQSEMWGAAQRFIRKLRQGKAVQILHFGDHDPSGIDMTRDIIDRITMFTTHHVGDLASLFQVHRLALNMDQVEHYGPPENPAKITDSRFASYEAVHGDKSWELDALNPRILDALVRKEVAVYTVDSVMEKTRDTEATARGVLRVVADQWDHIEEHVTEVFPEDLEEAKDKARADLDGEAGVETPDEGEDDE